MKLNIWAKLGIACAILAACGYGGYQYYVSQQAAKQVAEIETVTVSRMDLKSTVSATGTIEPVNSVEVSSKITARLKEVLVKENDTVRAGQTVATLDGKDFEAKRDQASFKVINTKSKYERVQYLHSIGAKSDEELENAAYDYNTAMSSLEETESDLAETIILAPMDGTVVGEPRTAGTMATQGSDNPTVIMRIADLSSKQIKAKIDETDIGNVRVGQKVTFTVDAYTGKTFTARVSKISQTDVNNSWDTTSKSSSSSSSNNSVIYYYVTMDVDDPDEDLLLPAMTARVEILTSEKPKALCVEIAALKTDAAGSYVVLVNPDRSTENRYVKTGIYSDEYVEILEGLNEGDEVSISYKAAAASSAKKNDGRGGPPHPI